MAAGHVSEHTPLGKTVPEVLDTARGHRLREVHKTEGTVFPNMDQPRLVNNIVHFV